MPLVKEIGLSRLFSFTCQTLKAIAAGVLSFVSSLSWPVYLAEGLATADCKLIDVPMMIFAIGLQSMSFTSEIMASASVTDEILTTLGAMMLSVCVSSCRPHSNALTITHGVDTWYLPLSRYFFMSCIHGCLFTLNQTRSH